MKNIITQIKEMYNTEWNNSSKINHDPFKGHMSETDGKSWFIKEPDVNIVHVCDVVNNDAVRIVKIITDNTVGIETKTDPTDTSVEMVVKEVHGCLQLCAAAEDVKILKTETNVVTVIITNEGEAGWCLATSFPGAPGINIGKELADAGYSDGDKVGVKEVPYAWLEHLVVL